MTTATRLQTDYNQTTNVSSSHVFPCLSCFLTVHASLSNIHESVIISNCLLQNCKDAKKYPAIHLHRRIAYSQIYSKYTFISVSYYSIPIRQYASATALHCLLACAYLRNPPLYHSNSTSAISPSPPGLAVLGWSLCMHQVSHLQQSQEVSQGIRPPEQSPAHMDSCQVRNS